MKKPEVRKKYYTRLMDLYRRYPVYIPFLNSLIRFTFSKKAAGDLRFIINEYAGKEIEIKDWYNHHSLFFGFAVLRSGTTFLADFLNKNLPEAIVLHEPNVNDYLNYSLAMQNPADALKYIEEYRLKEIYHRVHFFPIMTYGEINPFLRRHSAALKNFCPQAKQFHLVRDGRDVLRSLMSREIFDVNDPMATLVFPPAGDEFLEGWKKRSRFEKLCWLWKSDNEYLRKNIPHVIHFEKAISDYDYFKTSLTDYLQIGTIAPDVWKKGIEKVKNQTPKYRFPSFSAWGQKEKIFFEKICGEEMEKLGY